MLFHREHANDKKRVRDCICYLFFTPGLTYVGYLIFGYRLIKNSNNVRSSFPYKEQGVTLVSLSSREDIAITHVEIRKTNISTEVRLHRN